VPRHSPRVFVSEVDVVSGVGYDRSGGPFHDVYRVVTNLAVLDFGGPLRTMRLVSVHPGVSVADVVEQTGFPLDVNGWCVTRSPSDAELRLLDTLDPAGRRLGEVPS
jgi:hypothetical protein